MDRSMSSTSMDELVGSIWKAANGGNFPRTDSELQFQEFLKKIPSTTNLASYQGNMQGLGQAQQEQLQQQMAQFQQQSLQLTSSTAPLSAGMTQLPDGGSLNVGGIPRVPSLDLLRQLVNQQQGMSSPPPARTTVSAAAVKHEPVMEAPLPVQTGDTMRPSTLPTLPALPLVASAGIATSIAQPIPVHGQINPVIAAAALQLGHLTSLQGLGNVRKQPESAPTGKDGKAEVRRARRMLSNRESARRSRRRKQEHLSTLEEQISQLEEERDSLQDRVDVLEKQANTHAEQNKALRKENEELKRQMEDLQGEGKVLSPPERGSRGHRGGNEHPNKRFCNGNS